MADRYEYQVGPTALPFLWDVTVNEVGWSGIFFWVFGTQDRAVRKAMKRIARWQRKAARKEAKTVRGVI